MKKSITSGKKVEATVEVSEMKNRHVTELVADVTVTDADGRVIKKVGKFPLSKPLPLADADGVLVVAEEFVKVFEAFKEYVNMTVQGGFKYDVVGTEEAKPAEAVAVAAVPQVPVTRSQPVAGLSAQKVALNVPRVVRVPTDAWQRTPAYVQSHESARLVTRDTMELVLSNLPYGVEMNQMALVEKCGKPVDRVVPALAVLEGMRKVVVKRIHPKNIQIVRAVKDVPGSLQLVSDEDVLGFVKEYPDARVDAQATQA